MKKKKCVSFIFVLKEKVKIILDIQKCSFSMKLARKRLNKSYVKKKKLEVDAVFVRYDSRYVIKENFFRLVFPSSSLIGFLLGVLIAGVALATILTLFLKKEGK
jgi:hypothetical protein